MDDTTIEHTPVITGAVYRRVLDKRVEEMLCIGRSEEKGRVTGLFRRLGYSFERFDEGGEDLLGWELHFNPRDPKNFETATALEVVEKRGPGRPRKTTAKKK